MAEEYQSDTGTDPMELVERESLAKKRDKMLRQRDTHKKTSKQQEKMQNQREKIEESDTRPETFDRYKQWARLGITHKDMPTGRKWCEASNPLIWTKR